MARYAAKTMPPGMFPDSPGTGSFFGSPGKNQQGRASSPDDLLLEGGANVNQGRPGPVSHMPAVARLPRDGAAPGGGRMQVQNRDILEAVAATETPMASDAPEGLSKGRARKSREGSRPQRSTDSKTTTTTDSPRSNAPYGDREKFSRARLSPQERKRFEMAAKLQKTQEVRERDQKFIRERLEKSHDRRESRFKRLYENVTGRDNLAYKTSMALRERDAHEDRRRHELHTEWESKVYQPIATQAFERLNPKDRALEQEMQGYKNVDFLLPSKEDPTIPVEFRIRADVRADPSRRSLADTAWENAFHTWSHGVLGHSRSAPSLGAPYMPADAMGALGVPAKSRPVLEPENWNPVPLQGTLYGHFAQVSETGEGFRRGRRGGANVFIPDESDGVFAAGTRLSRETGYGDKGILRGTCAYDGEASSYKTAWGSSSAAPGQDHYTFDATTRLTDIEFPLGKRMDPNFH